MLIGSKKKNKTSKTSTNYDKQLNIVLGEALKDYE